MQIKQQFWKKMLTQPLFVGKMLGMEALEHLNFDVAKKAFHRVKDCRALLLIHDIEVRAEKKKRRFAS